MATVVGWATFTIELVMFGTVLGVVVLRTAPADHAT
jgi:hypothetical protein